VNRTQSNRPETYKTPIAIQEVSTADFKRVSTPTKLSLRNIVKLSPGLAKRQSDADVAFDEFIA
jgi:hypothetical protein